MVYDVDIIYVNNYLSVQFGNSIILLDSSTEDFFTSYYWGYIYMTGFHNGNARKMYLESLMVCEDSLSNNLNYSWNADSLTTINETTSTVGTILFLTIKLLDSVNQPLPHLIGHDVWTWNVNITPKCGFAAYVKFVNDFEFMFSVFL